MITRDGETGQELERRSLVKGYEFRKGKYLLMSDEDLDSVKVESSSVMTIEKFVDTASIDPVYYAPPITSCPTATPGRTFMPCCGKPSLRPAKRRCRAS
jgi:DNA end-binding protein Ku